MPGAALVRPSLAVLVALALTGCSGGGDDTPGPQEPALALAAALDGGLQDGEMDGLAFVDSSVTDVEADWSDTTEGLGDLVPTVAVSGVAETEDEPVEGVETAAATLDWSWDVAGKPWTYTTTVPMRLPETDDAGSGTWELQWSRTVVEPSLREATTLALTPVAARRGEVLGGDGEALVTDRLVTRVGIDRTQVPAARAAASARALAALVDVAPGPYAERVEEAGDAAFVEALVLRTEDVPPPVGPGVAEIDGARLISDRLPLAPTREFAAPILGTVGEVTAEMVEEDPEAYAPGDVAGLSGLQARYDDVLRGTDGAVLSAVAPDGRERRLVRVADQDGDPLRTTLDEDLQLLAEEVLADVGPASALVALRPSDGAVLAAASGPGAEGLNVATYGQYAPGSTFKIVSSLALLRGGLTPTSTVPCTPTVTVDGRVFENYDDYPAGSLGRVPLRTAVAQSCNTAMIAERDRAGADGVATAAAALGLGVDRDLGFPSYFGQVGTPGSETGRAATMIGQGEVLASPMAMAAVVGSVQQGARVTPRLLPDVEVDTDAGDEQPLTSTEAEQLRGMLRAVVTEGSGSSLADLSGPPVIAKTGTAEFEDGGELRTRAWMVAAQGDLAVAVLVAEGSSGSGTAGPLLEAFLRTAG
ncbi:penicillin-binding transpeptidase domain-containing protein [Nocardioides sp. AX2bis]|uniref:penicillin-binding transpeptidase domain-containing protein n=1 Tax=Nocardioides sp. AX2bis TaxID=2653157 RepID=UPI001F20E35A|nr:penicillin-binding transpeptidase domain-containing protein [Nocardioides sp. AX2bis]